MIIFFFNVWLSFREYWFGTENWNLRQRRAEVEFLGKRWKSRPRQIQAEGQDETTAVAGCCLILPKMWAALIWGECHWLWHRWVGQPFSFFLSLFHSFCSSVSLLSLIRTKCYKVLFHIPIQGRKNILKYQEVLQDGKTISQTGLAMSSRTFKQLWSKTIPQPHPFWLSPVKWVFSKYYIMTPLNPTKLFPQEITLSQLDSNYLLYLMTL